MTAQVMVAHASVAKREPKVELVYGYNLNSKEIKILEQLIKERLYEIKEK